MQGKTQGYVGAVWLNNVTKQICILLWLSRHTAGFDWRQRCGPAGVRISHKLNHRQAAPLRTVRRPCHLDLAEQKHMTWCSSQHASSQASQDIILRALTIDGAATRCSACSSLLCPDRGAAL